MKSLTLHEPQSALILWDDREIPFPRRMIEAVRKARAKGEVVTVRGDSYAAAAIKEIRSDYHASDMNYAEYDAWDKYQDTSRARLGQAGKLVKVKNPKTGFVTYRLRSSITPELEIITQ